MRTGWQRTIDALIGLIAIVACVAAVTWVIVEAMPVKSPSELMVAREIVWMNGQPWVKTCYLAGSHTSCELR